MPESAGLYVSENKHMISLYIIRYIFVGLAKNRPPKSPLRFNRLDSLPYYSAPFGIRPHEWDSVAHRRALRSIRIGRDRLDKAILYDLLYAEDDRQSFPRDRKLTLVLLPFNASGQVTK